jgi:hypothetical protein
LLASHFNVNQYTLDRHRDELYNELGYDAAYAKKIFADGGVWALYSYWKPFEAFAVKKVLRELDDCVIDFGAGHSVFEEESVFDLIEHVLLPFKNVVLLLPSEDIEESLEILAERRGYDDSTRDLNRHFLEHPSNRRLAKHIVFTKNKTEEMVAQEVIQLVKGDFYSVSP